MVVLFIGADGVGKETVSRLVAKELGFKGMHLQVYNEGNFMTKEERDEVLVNIPQYVKKGIKVFSVGGNLFQDVNPKQIEVLRTMLDEELVIYHLQPYPNRGKSFRFLLKLEGKSNFKPEQIREDVEVRNQIMEINSLRYREIATKTINTLQKENGKFMMMPNNAMYARQLRVVAGEISKELKGMVKSEAEKEKKTEKEKDI